ncbi:MAG: AI-2E family transporter [Deltaproteobacteria bacterium]|nr:AI-2E family transporter [Deltaproteobacteria bacterium]
MNEKGPKAAFLALLIFLIIAFFAVIRPFLLPALFAVIIVVICNPIYNFFVRFVCKWRYAAALLSTIVVSLCILAPLAFIIGVVVSNAASVSGYIVSQLEGGELASAIDGVNRWISALTSRYAEFIPPDFNLRETLVGLLKSVSLIVYKYSPQVVSAGANIIGGIILLVIFILVLFAEGGRIYQSLISLLPLKDEHKQVLAREVRGVISGTFLGMMATSFAQALLIGIGFWIAGISKPAVWGAVAIGVTLIPVVGGPLMYVPAAIILMISGKFGTGLFLLLYGVLLVSMIDNVIKPLVMRGKVNIHPLLLALSLIGGAIWLGPAGMIVGPLVVVLMLAMLKIYQQEFA